MSDVPMGPSMVRNSASQKVICIIWYDLYDDDYGYVYSKCCGNDYCCNHCDDVRCSHGAFPGQAFSLSGSNLSNSSLIALSQDRNDEVKSTMLWVLTATVYNDSLGGLSRCKSHSRLAGGNFTQFCQLIAIRSWLFIQIAAPPNTNTSYMNNIYTLIAIRSHTFIQKCSHGYLYSIGHPS